MTPTPATPRVPNRVIPSALGATFVLDDGVMVAVVSSPGWESGQGPARWLVYAGTYAPRTVLDMHHTPTSVGELVAVPVGSAGSVPALNAPASPTQLTTWVPPMGCKVVDTRVEPYKSCLNPQGYTFRDHPVAFVIGDEWIDQPRGWGKYLAVVPATWEPRTVDPARTAAAMHNLLQGAAEAMLWRGALRLSKNHVGKHGEIVWGIRAMHGAPWLAYEGAVAFHDLARRRGGEAYAALERWLYASRNHTGVMSGDIQLLSDVINREAEARNQ